jgi:glycosyltransferase involved in cell wall biosynthesis
MPVAKRLAREKTPILLETHDIQARQFEIMNKLNWCLKPRVTYEQLLAEELGQLEKATALIHLNSEEKSLFESLLPNKKHLLLYPRVNKITPTTLGNEVIMIAANNPPNLESICWLLDKVAPQTTNFSVSIYGDADKGMQKFFPELFNKFKSNFKGEIKNLEEAYKNAKAIILPAISGHGLSIKTVEALSTGLPLIATSIAFRGMDLPSQSLQGVFIADTAEVFAAALDKYILKDGSLDNTILKSFETVEFYNQTFSPARYKENLAKIAGQFV